ncbi:MAG: hypothetical protein ABSD68_01165 [Candidatus Micrarchaeales archaeon]
MRKLRSKKAQSAMEYLMTYGWAILIIAVVLGALFSLGVFSGASVLGTACVAGPGFLCSGLIYTHGTGNLAVTIGQSTGTNWAVSNIILAIQGNALSTNGGPIVPPIQVTSGATMLPITSGQSIPVTFAGVGAAPAVGASIAGSIWACYGTSGATAIAYAPNGLCQVTGGTAYYTQVATFTAKAT